MGDREALLALETSSCELVVLLGCCVGWLLSLYRGAGNGDSSWRLVAAAVLVARVTAPGARIAVVLVVVVVVVAEVVGVVVVKGKSAGVEEQPRGVVGVGIGLVGECRLSRSRSEGGVECSGAG